MITKLILNIENIRVKINYVFKTSQTVSENGNGPELLRVALAVYLRLSSIFSREDPSVVAADSSCQ